MKGSHGIITWIKLTEMGIDPTPASGEQNQVEKVEILLGKEFLNNELPQALFVLSGGINPDPVERLAPYNIGFRSPSFASADRTGMITGGKARVVAAAEIGKRFSEITIVTTSKVEQDRPSHAAVMANELRQRGIAETQIRLEEISHDTWTEMVELVKMVVDSAYSRVGIVTNKYHAPRAEAMLDNLERYLEVNPDQAASDALYLIRQYKIIQIKFFAAETVLETIDPRWSGLFQRAQQTEGYIKRLQAEANGLRALNEGTYTYMPRPKA